MTLTLRARERIVLAVESASLDKVLSDKLPNTILEIGIRMFLPLEVLLRWIAWFYGEKRAAGYSPLKAGLIHKAAKDGDLAKWARNPENRNFIEQSRARMAEEEKGFQPANKEPGNKKPATREFGTGDLGPEQLDIFQKSIEQDPNLTQDQIKKWIGEMAKRKRLEEVQKAKGAAS